MAKLKSALFRLKINIFLSLIPQAIDLVFPDGQSSALEKLLISAYIPSIPLITLIGAFHVKKIIEQRDRFAKVSSYSGDHYLWYLSGIVWCLRFVIIILFVQYELIHRCLHWKTFLNYLCFYEILFDKEFEIFRCQRFFSLNPHLTEKA